MDKITPQQIEDELVLNLVNTGSEITIDQKAIIHEYCRQLFCLGLVTGANEHNKKPFKKGAG